MLGVVLRWWPTLLLIGWLAWPLVRRVWSATPDGGYALSRVAGLLLLGYLYWIVPSLGIVSLGRPWLWTACGLLGAAGLWLGWRDRSLLRDWVKHSWRRLLVCELLFAVGLGLVVLLRAHDPMISHTEQPMDYAMLNSILGSDSLPPHDLWMAGERISYYYGGYWLVALLERLTGTPSGLAYNLGLASVAGLGLTAAYGLLQMLIPPQSRVGRGRWAICSALGALGLFFLGTFEWPLEVLHALGVGGEGFWRWLAIPGLSESIPSGRFLPSDGWWWWRASRVIYDANWLGRMPTVISEFPAFSLVLGDLHPHLTNLPALLLGLALGVALARRPFGRRDRATWLPWVLAPIVLGWLGFGNSWDLPTVGLWTVALYGIDLFRREGIGWRTVGRVALVALWLGGMSLLLYAPFYAGLRSQVRGIGTVHYAKTRLSAYLLIYGLWLLPIIGVVWSRRKDIQRRAFVAVWAALLVLPWLVTWALEGVGALLWGVVATVTAGPWVVLLQTALLAALAVDVADILRQGTAEDVQSASEAWLSPLCQSTYAGSVCPPPLCMGGKKTAPQGDIGERASQLRASRGAAGVSAKGTEPCSCASQPTGSLGYEPFGTTTALAAPPDLGQRATPDASHVTLFPRLIWDLLCILGLGLTWIVEFFYLRDMFDSRTNTVFKFGYQAWMLLGLAAVSALVTAWRRGGRERRWSALGALMILLCLGYAPAAAWSKTEGFSRSPGLDGTAYVAEAYSDEWAAIAWLRANAGEGDVLVEAPGTDFCAWTSRVSAWSGVPSVLGWPGHEAQWRGSENAVRKRMAVLDAVYRGMDTEALSALEPFGATLLVVGPAERERYGESLREPDWEPLFSRGEVVVYRLP